MSFGTVCSPTLHNILTDSCRWQCHVLLHQHTAVGITTQSTAKRVCQKNGSGDLSRYKTGPVECSTECAMMRTWYSRKIAANLRDKQASQCRVGARAALTSSTVMTINKRITPAIAQQPAHKQCSSHLNCMLPSNPHNKMAKFGYLNNSLNLEPGLQPAHECASLTNMCLAERDGSPKAGIVYGLIDSVFHINSQ